MEKQRDPQEFRSGPQITMQISLTREQYLALVEWSNSIPTLYFLDICVVGATKLTEAALEKSPRKSRLVTRLREIDRPQNCFSYLCALMEKVSDSRGKLTNAELENQILIDLSTLRSFFKYARVYESDDFLIEFLRELRGSAIEMKVPNYLRFVESANNQFLLRDPVSPKKRLNTAIQLIKTADSLEVSRKHPTLLITLACLYGNSAARNLMKFKADSEKFQAENALADIMAIQRFSQLKLQIEYMGRQGAGYLRSDFITDDDGLAEIFKCFKPNVVRHIDVADGRETHVTFDVNLKQLLTEISQDDYEHILELLNQESQSNLGESGR